MRPRTRRGGTNSQEDERDEEDMGGAFVYSFKQWNSKLTAMVENYNENGIDGFFSDDKDKTHFRILCVSLEQLASPKTHITWLETILIKVPNLPWMSFPLVLWVALSPVS